MSTTVTPADQQQWEAWRAAKAADPQCTRCGTKTSQGECPDWCLRISSGCNCGHPHCGVCMRSMGTTLASMGHP